MRKRLLIPLIAGGTLAAAGTIAWLNREAIVADYVDSTLEEAGARATYQIDRIGVRQQRLRNIVIGDPRNPDLTAREVDLVLGIGWAGPVIESVRVRGARLNGRWVDGTLSLGEIDKLLPEPDGTPPGLPDFVLDIAGSSARIDTPWGVIALDAEGRGQLFNGFAGSLGIDAPRLALGGCALQSTTGLLRVSTVQGAPTVRGPMGIERLNCVGAAATVQDMRIGVDTTLTPDFTRIRSRTGLRATAGRAGTTAIDAITASLSLNGALQGEMQAGWTAVATGAANPAFAARRLTLSGQGRRTAAGAIVADGRAAVEGGTAGASLLRSANDIALTGQGTPLGPLAQKLGRALALAGRSFAGGGSYTIAGANAGSLTASASDVLLSSASGARLRVIGDRALRWSAATGLAIDGAVELAGGGLPEARLALRRSMADGSLSGDAVLAPYQSGNAVLAIAPVRFVRAGDGRTRFATGAAVSGPLADGFVDRLSLPLSGMIGADGSVSIDGTCQPLRWQSISVSGTSLDPAAIRLCGKSGGPLLAWSSRGLSGGVTLPGFALTGRSGDSALRVATGGGSIDLASTAFALRGVDASIGSGKTATRFTAAAIEGRTTPSGLGGTLRDGSGAIGVVPFLLSGANGDWRVANGALTLDTALLVDDAEEVDRFQRLASDSVTIRFADGVVSANGLLSESVSRTPVVRLDIDHRFATSSGNARFTVPPIAFVRDGLQPVDVSRLALGVIANVEGSVSGGGSLRWNAEGIVSEGSFATDRLDLAAAFGPVERLSGTIRFDDLLALSTPPGQEVRLGSVNPGVEVTDGRIFYQMLPGQRVRIERGVWPFAGGQLLLQPALLDFSADRPRRLTFDVSSVDAAIFLQRFEFDNISATGVFDGVLPTIFDADGGRVLGGSLVSRDGGGTLAYVGELSNRDLGTMANLAYGALKSLRYDNLVIRLNGRIDGEMLTEVDFSGLAQGEGAETNFFTRAIAKLPFTFRIRINAPFRQLLTSARGLYDPADFIDQNLDSLLRAEREAAAAAEAARTGNGGNAAPVQPSESEDQR